VKSFGYAAPSRQLQGCPRPPFPGRDHSWCRFKGPCGSGLDRPVLASSYTAQLQHWPLSPITKRKTENSWKGGLLIQGAVLSGQDPSIVTELVINSLKHAFPGPRDQERADLLTGLALHRHLAIPADPDQFGETARIVLVALVHPPRKRSMGMAGVDADDGQADPPQFVPEPARHGTGLEADALGLRRLLRQQRGQGARIRLRPPLENWVSAFVHHTDRCLLLRHVQPNILFNGEFSSARVSRSVCSRLAFRTIGSNYVIVCGFRTFAAPVTNDGNEQETAVERAALNRQDVQNSTV